MKFGSQTVTLRSYVTATGRDRLNQPNQDVVDVVVDGVLMRPVTPTEVITLTDIATETWRCTAPAITATLAAKASDELVYQSNTYQITGVQPFSNLAGAVDHVRITCQRQVL